MLNLTDSTFDHTINNAPAPVLVDFWAPWCAPCRTIAPIVEQIAEKYTGRLVVAKVDLDDNEQLVQRFGIRSIPTLLVFKNGDVVGQLVGAVPAKVIENEVLKHI
jgi:thioredoxin 1